MDQDATWYEGRRRPRRHCVRWESSAPLKGAQLRHFSAHVYRGQTVGWIKMPLGMEAGLGPDHVVLDEDPAPPKGHSPLTQFSAHVYCDQTVAHLSYC